MAAALSLRQAACVQETAAAEVGHPDLALQTGHAGDIVAVWFTPDGCRLVTEGKDKTVRVWELATGRELRTISIPADSWITLIKDASLVAAVTYIGKSTNAAAWDLATGRQVLNMALDAATEDVRFSPNGRWLVSRRAKGQQDAASAAPVTLWEVATGRRVNLPTEKLGEAIAFSPDSQLLATVGEDSMVRLWEVATGREVRALAAPGAKALEWLGFSPDGRWLAFVNSTASLMLWEVSTGREIRSHSFRGWYRPHVAFSLDSRWLAANADHGTKLWNLETGAEVVTVAMNGYLAFSRDGRWLFADDGNRVAAWEVNSGRSPRILRSKEGTIPSAFSPDGRWFAFAEKDRVHVHDLESGLEFRTLAGYTTSLDAVAFAADGRTLALGSEDSDYTKNDDAIRLFDVSGGHLVHRLAQRFRNGVHFSPDSRWMVGGGGLWEVATGRKVAELSGGFLAFTLSSRFLAIGSHDAIGRPLPHIQLWDLEHRKGAGRLSLDRDLREAVFDPQGHWLAATGGEVVRIWDLTAGKEVAQAKPGSVVVTPDGRWEASKPLYGEMVVRERATGRELLDLRKAAVLASRDGRWLALPVEGFEGRKHRIEIRDQLNDRTVTVLEFAPASASSGLDSAEGVVFAPDGQRLLAVSHAEITLWDITTGREIRSAKFGRYSNRVTHVDFCPKGGCAVLSGSDNSAHVWDAATGTDLAQVVAMRETNDWVVVTPDGLFDGSPEGMQKLVAWRFGNQTAPLEALFNEFYYPGLLAEILAGRRPHAPRDFALLDRRQPVLKLALGGAQVAGGLLASRTVTVKLDLAEAPADAQRRVGSGARDVRLFRNGSLVKVWRGDVLKGQPKVTLEATVHIVAGENRFTAYAFNRDNIKSSDAELVVTGAESLRRKGTAYVLAIGINQYANRDYNLNYAVADAQAFADELARQQAKLGEYAKVEVVSLLDKEATKANLLAALRRLAGEVPAALSAAPSIPAPRQANQRRGPRATPHQKGTATTRSAEKITVDLSTLQPAQPEDAVFVYYAGHGTASGPRFYLIPHDLGYTGSRTEIDEAGLKAILDHSISDRDLEQAFEKIDAGRLLLVIDACNSGQALEAEEKRRGPMNSKGLAQLAYEKGMYVLTASQGYQAAQEAAQLGHGFLTYALVEEGLKTAAADNAPQDGQVILREWLDYATLRVPQMQETMMQDARKLGREVAVVEGEEKIRELAKRSLQRPRVFYRREPEAQPLVVARPEAGR